MFLEKVSLPFHTISKSWLHSGYLERFTVFRPQTLPQVQAELTIWQCEYAFNIMAPLALGLIKLSVLCFYRRIFRGRVFDIINWTLIALVVLWTLGFFLVQVFDCRTHFSTNWGTLRQLQKCLDTFSQFLAYTVSDVIIDVFILALPVPLVSIDNTRYIVGLPERETY